MKLSLFKHKSRSAIVAVVIVAIALVLVNLKFGGKDTLANKARNTISKALTKYPACPKNLAGILTAPLMDPRYISALTPLGNINPPGHTSPVDHNYFSTEFTGKIPLLAPADAWITSLTEILKANDAGKYLPTGYVVSYTVCDGLILDFASYTGLIKPLTDQLATTKQGCKYGIVKPGHTGGAEGQCYYQVHYQVKSGQRIGWVQAIKRGDALDLPFEIWAANYNKPERADVNWAYYNDNRYAHSMCTFDLYAGDLKQQYMEKFGGIVMGGDETQKTRTFVRRTIEPVCGEVNQDKPGSIQGMWFGAPPAQDSLEFRGIGLAFLHNNIDPIMGEISIGGNFIENAGVVMFRPTHSGKIDREPSEVKADGSIYCYNADQGGTQVGGKVLVQLVDDHHMRVEHLAGSCGGNETFKRAFDYQR